MSGEQVADVRSMCVFRGKSTQKGKNFDLNGGQKFFSNSALTDSSALSVATCGLKPCCSKTVALKDTLHRT